MGRTAPVDSAQIARSVREDTAELASYLLSDGSTQRRPSFLQRNRPSSQEGLALEFGDADSTDGSVRRSSGTILEVSEPPSPEEQEDGERTGEGEGPSALANLLRRASPPSSLQDHTNIPQARVENVDADQTQSSPIDETPHRPEAAATEISEYTPLLGRRTSGSGDSTSVDLEGQKTQARARWLRGLAERRQKAEHHVIRIAKIASSPRSWNGKAIWETAVVDPVSCLPAVAVGLLLNILDALSYGESLTYGRKKNATDQSRYDSVSTWNASFLSFRICWYFYILCQHNCGPTRLLYGQYIQRGRRIRIGTCNPN
jgi:SulP family sulfate permease